MADLITKVLNSLGLERKSAPDYGASTTMLPERFPFRGWGWNKSQWGSNINYAQEVGPLENSSLIAAILNWTATQLPEARPVHYTRDSKGDEVADALHPSVKLIRRPNPFHTWSNYAGALSLDWWVGGNFHLKKERDVGGTLQELWYLPSSLIKPRWPGDGLSPDVPTSGKNKATNDFVSHYQFGAPRRDPVLINASDMVHLKRFVNPGDPRMGGVGAFDAVIKEIYGDEKAALFAATILRNMGIVVPILSPKDKDMDINETQAQHIKENWVKGTTGDNVGVPMVNSIALEATKLAFSPTELDLSELRKVPESRIAAVTGIPAIVLQFLVGLEHGHYGAAYEQARQQGYESVIIPIQADIAEQLSLQLLYEFDKNTEGQEIRFDTSHVRVLQEDRDQVYRRSGDAYRAGITTLNEARASLGKPDLGDEGNVYLVPGMSTPMTLERLTETATGEREAPEPDPNAEALGKLADIDRYLAKLDEQMKDYQLPK